MHLIGSPCTIEPAIGDGALLVGETEVVTADGQTRIDEIEPGDLVRWQD